jgi:hypothetical protein
MAAIQYDEKMLLVLLKKVALISLKSKLSIGQPAAVKRFNPVSVTLKGVT